MRCLPLARARGGLCGAALTLLLAAPASLAAQSPPPSPATDDVCLGFRFGAWTPALDWRRAGHDIPMDSARVARAPGGRAWAETQFDSDADSSVMLFPPWWPAGVSVTLARSRLAFGDTVDGRASALVADGRLKPSTATVRAFRIPCGR